MPRTESEVPLAEARGMFTEADRACNAWPSSPETSAYFTSSGVKTSIGTALSNTLRSFTREPNTVTDCRISIPPVGTASSARAAPMRASDATGLTRRHGEVFKIVIPLSRSCRAFCRGRLAAAMEHVPRLPEITLGPILLDSCAQDPWSDLHAPAGSLAEKHSYRVPSQCITISNPLLQSQSRTAQTSFSASA